MTGLLFLRVRGHHGPLAAALLAILTTTTILATLAAFAGSAGDAGLRHALRTRDAAAAALLVTTETTRTPPAAADRAVLRGAREAFGQLPVTLSRFDLSGPYALPRPAAARGGEPDLAEFGAVDRSRVRLTAGSWPAAAGPGPGGVTEVAVPEAAARRLGLTPGPRTVRLTGRMDAPDVLVRVSGVYRPADPADPYWQLDRLGGRGVRTDTFTTYGPLLTHPAALGTGRIPRRQMSWLATADFGTLRADHVDALRTAAREAKEFRAARPELAGDAVVRTALPDTLDRLERALLVSRATLLVVSAQLALLAGYALLLVARLLTAGRTAETRLLLARGASRRRVASLAALEALLLALPAAVCGPLLAGPLTRLLAERGLPGGAGPLLDTGPTPQVWLTAAAVALACAAAVATPALGAARTAGGRPRTLPAPLRAGADLALLAVAAVAYWQLGRRTSGSGTLTADREGRLGIDPLLVAAPALALLAGAVLTLRLLPPAARLAERRAARGRGLTAPLAGWQLSRRPLRATGPVLLLVLAVALGMLTIGHGASWDRSQDDQADFRAGAPVRVLGGGTEPFGRGGAYGAIPGVRAAVPAARLDFGLSGGRRATVLALDTAMARDELTLRHDLADAPPDRLLAPLDPAYAAPDAKSPPAPPRNTPRPPQGTTSPGHDAAASAGASASAARGSASRVQGFASSGQDAAASAGASASAARGSASRVQGFASSGQDAAASAGASASAAPGSAPPAQGSASAAGFSASAARDSASPGRGAALAAGASVSAAPGSASPVQGTASAAGFSASAARGSATATQSAAASASDFASPAQGAAASAADSATAAQGAAASARGASPSPSSAAPAAITVPGDTARLALGLTLDGGSGPGRARAADLTLTVEDRHGVPYRVPLGALPADGRPRTLTADLARAAGAPDGRPAGPLSLTALDIDQRGQPLRTVPARLTLTALRAVTADGAPRPVTVPPGLDWRARATVAPGHDPQDERQAPPAVTGVRSTSATPLDLAYHPGRTAPDAWPPGERIVTVRVTLGAPATSPPAALATDRFLESTGARTGSVVRVPMPGGDLTVRIAGTLRALPTTGPGAGAATGGEDGGALLLDLRAVNRVLSARPGSPPPSLPPTEWWLFTAPGAADRAATALRNRADTDPAQVVVRDEIAARLHGDPLGAGPRAALLAATVAAALLAAVGFAVSTAGALRERSAEFAVLRALGAPRRQTARLVALEQSLLIAVALVIGPLLGALLTRALVPLVVLTGEATRPVPGVLVALPPGRIALLLLAVAAAPLATVAVTALRGADPATALRARGGE
ncbi:FtsX-like permease family protein [Streptomyces coeruleoprunus]|uniref:FtsX-like permease family protein n=1 Tax=Streptomyces coeruleoprunus TaxID=285563 RepID=UPI0035EF826D